MAAERTIFECAIGCFERSADSSRRLFTYRGERHVVVVFGRNDAGGWMIGDPAFGKSTWSDEDFQNRFTGEALFVPVARKKFA